MVETRHLKPAELRRRCDPADLGFATTAELKAFPDFIGQERALDAIRLSATIPQHDFNLFVVGPDGSGRHAAVTSMLSQCSSSLQPPADWVYVNNFDAPHRPRALRLPPGEAVRLQRQIEELIDDLALEMPTLFETDDYRNQRQLIDAEFGERQEGQMAEFVEKASAAQIALLRTPTGFMLAARKGDEALKKEEFDALEKQEQRHIEEKIAQLQEELANVLQQAPKLDKERRKRIEALHADMADSAVSRGVKEVAAHFPDLPEVQEHLAAMRTDMIANAELFVLLGQQEDRASFPQAIRRQQGDPRFHRFQVNVMVSHADGDAVPIETEVIASLDRLIGRIEHVSEMGALMTNFMMIKPGALHRANGGFLVLDARRILREPFAWEALKDALRSRAISISSAAERLSLTATTSLEPEPIPLQVRAVLIGDRILHTLMVMLDPEFSELFKVQADFEEDVTLTPSSQKLYARLLGARINADNLRPHSAAAVARLLEEAIRMAEDCEKMSLQTGKLCDLMSEANHYAAQADRSTVELEDIVRALKERDRRAARVRDRMQEMIDQGTILIDTSGQAIGQVNGLSVIGMGGFHFGRPSRITARVRMGEGKLVDIEREVKLGGPLHSKGILILSGYLGATYAADYPLSLHAAIVFEQSYGGVDGDSASSAELYALLSALSGLPIRQGLAVTGSVNQIGQVQAIGGVNEKIEGFFDICNAATLTGDQGVLIPAANIRHLMLRSDVVEAVRHGDFRIIPVGTIDEGITCLTGVRAGQRGKNGAFRKGSVNWRVEERLISFARRRQQFAGDGQVRRLGKSP